MEYVAGFVEDTSGFEEYTASFEEEIAGFDEVDEGLSGTLGEAGDASLDEEATGAEELYGFLLEVAAAGFEGRGKVTQNPSLACEYAPGAFKPQATSPLA